MELKGRHSIKTVKIPLSSDGTLKAKIQLRGLHGLAQPNPPLESLRRWYAENHVLVPVSRCADTVTQSVILDCMDTGFWPWTITSLEQYSTLGCLILQSPCSQVQFLPNECPLVLWCTASRESIDGTELLCEILQTLPGVMLVHR